MNAVCTIDSADTYGFNEKLVPIYICLMPYAELPEPEKAYDRATATSTLKLICKMGCGIVK